MLKGLLSSLGIGKPDKVASTASDPYAPYAEAHVNFLYNLLFCDDLSLWRRNTSNAGNDPWRTLFADEPDKVALRRIADDATNEGRVRALAFNRLRASGEAVPAKILLGVIVEVPLELGLDVLAAFAEGGVRYLNQSGKVAIFEGAGHPVEALAKELVRVAQPLVDRIGPWESKRLPPPKRGNVRLTFLVSDGLYFGEGPFAALQGDPLAAPVIASATQLLQSAVAAGTAGS